jgi:hypothetical protein
MGITKSNSILSIKDGGVTYRYFPVHCVQAKKHPYIYGGHQNEKSIIGMDAVYPGFHSDC